MHRFEMSGINNNWNARFGSLLMYFRVLSAGSAIFVYNSFCIRKCFGEVKKVIAFVYESRRKWKNRFKAVRLF